MTMGIAHSQKLARIVGALVMGAGVLIGAFGAHGLSAQLSEYQKAIYQTAVHYQFIHGLGLLFLGLTPWQHRLVLWITTSFIVGIILFSGSLYAIALSAPKILGVITPIWGVLFVLGWLGVTWLAVTEKEIEK